MVFTVGLYLKKKRSSSFGQLVICFLITLDEKQHLIRDFFTLCRSSNGPEKAPNGIGAMFESDAGSSITLPESKQTVFQVKIFMSPTLLIFYTILF